MTNEMYIQIPMPCHENWDAMTPKQQGRFCGSCAKTVIDFSLMSNNEILNYLQNHNNLCGRFRDDQLEKAITPEVAKVQKISWWHFLISGLLFFKPAIGNAQKGKIRVIEKKQPNEVPKTMGLPIKQITTTPTTIGDTVMTVMAKNTNESTRLLTFKDNITKEAIKYGNISYVYNGKSSSIALDSLGQIILPNNIDGKIGVTVTCIGYETFSSIIDVSNLYENKNTFYLTQKIKKNEEMVIVGYGQRLMGDVVGVVVNKKSKKIKRTIVQKIIDTFATKNNLTVYPNPLPIGTPLKVNYTTKAATQVRFQITDSKGQVISNIELKAIKGKNLYEFNLPQVAAGNYTISVYEKINKKAVSEQFVVL